MAEVPAQASFWRTRFALEHLRRFQLKQATSYTLHSSPARDHSKTTTRSSSHASAPAQKLYADIRVGVVGAGAAGLYTAMILDHLGIEYELIEASNRAGGRVHTHHFAKDSNNKSGYFVRPFIS